MSDTLEKTRELVCDKPNGDVRICILQRGWIYVGRFSRDGDMCKLENGRCIRYWGTTDGIGELRNGPTSKTKLDPPTTVEFHVLTSVAILHVCEDGWKSHV